MCSIEHSAANGLLRRFAHREASEEQSEYQFEVDFEAIASI